MFTAVPAGLFIWIAHATEIRNVVAFALFGSLADGGSTDVRFAPKAEVSRTLPVPQGTWTPDRISNPSNRLKRVTSSYARHQATARQSDSGRP
jgi:hypothetical protein